MEEIMIYIQEQLPIIVAYLIVFAECIGQILLKKLFKKDGRVQKEFVINKASDVEKVKNELLQEKAEWQKEKQELYKDLTAQAEKISKIEKALKNYAKRKDSK